MRLKVDRKCLIIAPEDFSFDNSARNLDVAFIEEVLGLKNDGDFVLLKRKNAVGLSSLAYLEAKKPRQEITGIEYADGSADVFLDLPDNVLSDLRQEAARQGISIEELVRVLLRIEVEKEKGAINAETL